MEVITVFRPGLVTSYVMIRHSGPALPVVTFDADSHLAIWARLRDIGGWRLAWTSASPTGSGPEGSSPNEFSSGRASLCLSFLLFCSMRLSHVPLDASAPARLLVSPRTKDCDELPRARPGDGRMPAPPEPPRGVRQMKSNKLNQASRPPPPHKSRASPCSVRFPSPPWRREPA